MTPTHEQSPTPRPTQSRRIVIEFLMTDEHQPAVDMDPDTMTELSCRWFVAAPAYKSLYYIYTDSIEVDEICVGHLAQQLRKDGHEILSYRVIMAVPDQHDVNVLAIQDVRKMKHRMVSGRAELLDLAVAGYIKEPSELNRPKGVLWGLGYCYVEELGSSKFTHRGIQYSLNYMDGCFYPFVFAER